MAFHSNEQQIGQTVGARIRAARVALRLTQRELAQPGFSVSYVSAIERGQIQPSLRALEIFAQRLGVSSTDLLSKPSGQALRVFSERDESSEHQQMVELQLLEAHLFILQRNYLPAIA